METRYYVQDESDDNTLSFDSANRIILPQIFCESYLKVFVDTHLFASRSHTFSEDRDGKEATSRKTPSSGISRMIKRRNETHYMHREKAFETL